MARGRACGGRGRGGDICGTYSECTRVAPTLGATSKILGASADFVVLTLLSQRHDKS